MMNRWFNHFFLVLLIYLPFRSFLINFLEKQTNLAQPAVFWTAHWYEPVLIVAFFAVFGQNLFRKRQIAALNAAVSALIVLGILSVLFFSADVGRALEGYRFSLISVIVLLLALRETDDAGNRFRKVYLTLASVLALWAIIERFLPLDYWAKWNLVSTGRGFGWGNFAVNTIYQSASVIGSPNRLGAYLLPAFFLVWESCRQTRRRFHFIFIFLIGAAIILTLSRSAIVGLAAGGILALFLFPMRAWARAAVTGTIIVLTIGLAILWNSDIGPFRDLLTHGASQSEHYSAIVNSWTEIVRRVDDPVKFLFGLGLGTAGPLAVKYGSGLISESWYFQLWLELGLVGLLLWLLLIYFVLRQLFARDEIGLFLAVAAVSAAAAFLHTWADNPALAITLFILVGSSLADRRVSK